MRVEAGPHLWLRKERRTKGKLWLHEKLSVRCKPREHDDLRRQCPSGALTTKPATSLPQPSSRRRDRGIDGGKKIPRSVLPRPA